MAKTNKQLSYIRHIILYAVVITTFLVYPVLGDVAFPNHDFESGTIGGAPTSWNVAGTCVLTNTSSYSGINSLKYTGSGWGACYNIDMTDIDQVSFYYRITSGFRYYIKFEGSSYGNPNYVFYTPSGVQGWTLFETSTTSLNSGNYDVMLVSDGLANGNIDLIWDDDYPPDLCLISFYPDGAISEDDPSQVYYYINDTWDGWNVFIEGSWTMELEGEEYTYDNIEYGMLEAPINPVSGYFDVWGNDYNNTEYEICLKAWYWDPDLGKSVFIDLACDTQTTIYNSTNYPEPTPEPTPDPTPDPTPTSTPTPEPTATAQPEPEPMNESLNTSFTYAYHGLVNDTIDGYFVPVYNFTDYVAQPLTMLNQTLCNFTIQMNETFSTASINLGISTNILFLILSGFPSKITNLFGYYLCWLIILMIFKGQT